MKQEYDFSSGKRGPVVRAAGKTRVTIWLDDDIVGTFRERAEKEGTGYQTLINSALRETIRPESAPVTIESLRRVLREEFMMV